MQWKGGFSGKVGGSTASRWCLSKQRAFQARGGRSVTPDAGGRQTEQRKLPQAGCTVNKDGDECGDGG